MGCDFYRKQLTAYLDQELNAPQKERMAQHLQSCQACRNQYDELQNTVNLLANAEKPALAPQFQAGWRSRIRQENLQAQKGFLVTWQSFFKQPPLFSIAGSLGIIVICFCMAFLVNRKIADDSLKTSHPQSLSQLSIKESPEAVYQLEIVKTGKQTQKVQQLLREFRQTHEEGAVLALRYEKAKLGIISGLKGAEAQALKEKLEALGAQVAVKIVAKKRN